ncbi:nucleoside recognition domain-containing protein [Heliophilum fasciatum]|uniref:Nucleoside recognition protein n=1 Tax=Heliophilum fasciatum TaxID=35700 RepID=A0A4R2RPR4_9FIRM|nr:nucleoside recognition domain-containing protein [Heliophilum fasciatum]MCW2278013.1 Fe2+ transport system protein B [Heliophilum fasciatum]TCP64367.1 nucleoside recognition protein [Heliophilum fasciatum]
MMPKKSASSTIPAAPSLATSSPATSTPPEEKKAAGVTFDTWRRGWQRSLQTLWSLSKVLVPLVMLTSILDQSGWLVTIGHACAPLLAWMGLPGEASVGLFLGFTANLYGAIGAATPLNLTVKQATIFGIMLVVAHGLPLEGVVLSRSGAPGVTLTVMRLLLGMALALLVNLLWPGL